MATPFQQSVWAAIKKIPSGKVTTYGEVARFLGNPNAARAVGSAVALNPHPPEIPCHRVVRNDQSIGQYSAGKGISSKISLLHSEGISFSGEKILDFERHFFRLPSSKIWRIYIVRCSDNSLYTGICSDIDRRIFEHNFSELGAKYTRSRRPVRLVFSEETESRSSATKREQEIKKMSRTEKEALILGTECQFLRK